MFYILNAFSPNMLIQSFTTVKFIKVSQSEARAILMERCQVIENTELIFISAIGNESTAKIVSNILYIEIFCKRAEVSLCKGDKGLIFTLSFRPEEGKVYDYLELCKLLEENKIVIYYFEVIQ